MEARKLIEALAVAEKLKNNTRHSWTSSGRRESVAEHSWRLSLMAWFVKDEFPEADIHRVILMCICHDLGEAFTGDIPSFEKNTAHEEQELQCLTDWIASLPAPFHLELQALLDEMEAQQTLESKLYKALDKLEVLVQHNEADLSTWIELEHSLNLTHGTEQVAFSTYLQNLKEEINRDTREKLRAGQSQK